MPFPFEKRISRFLRFNPERLKYAHKDAIIMHPGPMNRGVEISTDVADSSRSIILNQVTGGVAIRMAILYLILGGRD